MLDSKPLCSVDAAGKLADCSPRLLQALV